MEEFTISELAAGGGMLGICPLPGRFRAYSEDLDAVLQWRPDVVLTMTTLPEMTRHGADRLGQDLISQGIVWHPLPVSDFGTPTEEVQAAWPDLQPLLARGGRVLAHCYGGCGRSGMALLRLMVEAGEAGPAALTRLRAVRPCAVETDAQIRWAVGHRMR
ncbi:protein phosphatase [Nioella aestuarii]|uniref:phosphatase domain-containing putative toxin n=1 Tax=Nioella aestuarii TaxID=1662864 RepID=UPI003D7F6553